jgi:prepilin-type processing-associated H-X9-DG protein
MEHLNKFQTLPDVNRFGCFFGTDNAQISGMKHISRSSAVTFTEVLAVVAALCVLGWMLMPPLTNGCKTKPARIICVNNLKNVGLSFRIFATDNKDLFPPAILLSNSPSSAGLNVADIYRSLSNELVTPKILYCPDDRKRKPAESFTNMTPLNISYFASLSTTEENPDSFLAGDRHLQTNGFAVRPGQLMIHRNVLLSWSKEMHDHQGNIAMGDGSVQQLSSNRLRSVIREQGDRTNTVLIP